MTEFEDLEMGVDLAWGGHAILSAEPHCRLTRRVRDGAIFAEIWVPQQRCDDSPISYQYIGPVKLPSWPT